MSRTLRFGSTAAAALVLWAGVAGAATVTWDADGTAGGSTGGTGTWNDSLLLWDNAGAMQAWNSAANDVAFFGGTSGTVTLATTATANGLSFSTAGYLLTGGTLAFAGTTPTITVSASTAIASALSSGTSLLITGAGPLTFTGTMNVSGTFTTNASLFTVGGAGSITGTTPLQIGAAASTRATMKIDTTGSVVTTGSSGLVNVGAATGGAGALVLASGSLAISDFGTFAYLNLGNSASSYGYFEMTGGRLLRNGSGNLGADVGNASGAVGVYVQSGGTATYNRFIIMGNGAGVLFGQMTLTGGVLESNGSGQQFLIGDDGSGRLNVGTLAGGAALVKATTNLSLGFTGTTSSGYVNLNSGTVQFDNAAAGIRGDNDGRTTAGRDLTLSLNGGTIKANANNIALIWGGTDAPLQTLLFNGGLTVDTGTFTSAINADILATTGSGFYRSTTFTATATGVAGAGYIGPPVVAVTGGSGTGAQVNALVDTTAGTITGFVVTNPGQNYQVGDVLTFTLSGTAAASTPAAPYTYTLQASDLTANGTGVLTKTGAGTLTLAGSNGFTGNTTLAGGLLSLGTSSALAGGGNIVFSGGTLQFTSGNTVDYAARIKSSTTAAIAVDTNGQAVTFGGAIDNTNTGGLAKSGSGALTLSGTNTFTGRTLVSAGTLALNSNLALQNSPLDTSGAGTVVLGAGVTTPTLGGLIGATNLATAIASGYGSVTALTLNVATGTALTYSGTIGNGAAGMSLTKTGGGTQTLSGSNTFTGGVTLASGTLVSTNPQGFGATSNAVTIGTTSSNVALQLGGTAGFTAQQPITVSALGSGQAIIGSAITSVALAYSGAISLGRSATLQAGTSDRVTFSNAISGTGDLTIATPLLSGGRIAFTQSGSASANTFVGSITIENGATLQVGVAGSTNNRAIPDSTSIFFNTQSSTSTTNLRLSGGGSTNFETVNALQSNSPGAGRIQLTEGAFFTLTVGGGGGSGTFSGLITESSTLQLTLVKSGSGTQMLSGSSNTYRGGTQIAAGALGVGHASALGTGTVTFTGSSVLQTAFTGTLANAVAINTGVTGTFDTQSNTLALSAAIGGAGGLAKTGAGILSLGGVNTFAGATQIREGTLSLQSGASIASSSLLSVAGGAFLDVTAAGGLSLSGGQTLGGTGTVLGDLVVAGGATLSPGNSPGTLLQTGNETWGPGGNYNWQLYDTGSTAVAGTGWDLLSVTGTLTITAFAGSEFNVNLWTLQAIGPDDNGPALNFDGTFDYAWDFATYTGGIVGFDASDFRVVRTGTNGTGGFANDAPGTFAVRQKPGDATTLQIYYASVPEPGTLALAGIGLAAAGLLAGRRGRRLA